MSIHPHRTLLAMLQAASQTYPDQPALFDHQGNQMTFGRLLAHIRLMAERLNAQRQDRIVIALPNGIDAAAAFLGVSSIAVSAPLNPNLPSSEYEFYLQDLNATSVIVGDGSPDAIRKVASQMKLPIIELASCLSDDEIAASSYPLIDADPEDLALILHTSGTTSRPKLVPLTHTNLCSSAANIASSLALTRQDRCLNVMPLFHIHGLVGVLLASMHAQSSVICAKGYTDDTFKHQLHNLDPSWYSAVPTIHQSVLQLSSRETNLAENSSLRLIRSSSASLAPETMKQLELQFKVPVIEAYGMTEAAHQMASNPIAPGQQRSGSVGPAAGPEVAVMDEHGRFLGVDEIGEVVIRGANVTKGYLDNPDANQESFFQGWFRTGDQGRMDANGYLYLTGRLKEIVNRGGEKISPREVDEALLTHPNVVQAVAFAVPHPSLGEDLVAAVILDDAIGEETLRAHAFAQLAAHKVPSRIIAVKEIPKGPTGKLQRIGLHEKLATQLSVEYLAPRTEMEELMCDLWLQVLRADQVGVNDNFFALGGDSLSGVQLVNRLQLSLQIAVDIESVFQHPTIAAQAEYIEQILIDQTID